MAVNYFSRESVARLIASLGTQDDPRWRLTVVDNSCDETEYAALGRRARADERVSCVQTTENLGYFGGVRWGFTTSEPSSWTVLCNVDVLFDEDFVGRLLTGDYSGVPAPSILWRARDQNPFLILRPTPRQLRRWTWQFRWVPVARVAILFDSLMALVPTASKARPGQPIYAAHGSCLILPFEYFDGGGGLNHAAFLYGEEIYVAEQCRRIGLITTYQPELRVRHQAHATTGLWRSAHLIRQQREAIRQVELMLEGSMP